MKFLGVHISIGIFRGQSTFIRFQKKVSSAIGVLKPTTPRAAERGARGGGQLAPGPKQVGAPNLRNILKLNKAPSKSGQVPGINGYI